VPGTFGGGFRSARGEVAAPKDADRDVRRGSFADAEAAKPAPIADKRDTQPPDTPAEITFKPRPDYTEEARRLRLEGEVVLRVLFAASGEVRILELVRGLGHGLDETAVNAAQRIKFKPALRRGQAVDSTANVYIAFQLAF
jgi:TonB family protein